MPSKTKKRGSQPKNDHSQRKMQDFFALNPEERCEPDVIEAEAAANRKDDQDKDDQDKDDQDKESKQEKGE